MRRSGIVFSRNTFVFGSLPFGRDLLSDLLHLFILRWFAFAVLEALMWWCTAGHLRI